MSVRTSSKKKRSSVPGDFVVEHCEKLEKFAGNYSGVTRVPKDWIANKFVNALRNPSYKNEASFLNAWFSEPSQNKVKLKAILNQVLSSKDRMKASKYLVDLFNSVEREETITDEHMMFYKMYVEHQCFENIVDIQVRIFNRYRIHSGQKKNPLTEDVKLMIEVADAVPPHSIAALRLLDPEEAIKDKGLVYVGYVPELSALFESKLLQLLDSTEPEITQEELGAFFHQFLPFPLVVKKHLGRIIELLGLNSSLLVLSYDYYCPIITETLFEYFNANEVSAHYFILNNYYNAYVSHFIREFMSISVVYKAEITISKDDLVNYVDTTYSMKNKETVLFRLLETNVNRGIISAEDAESFFDMPSDIREQMLSIILSGE